jgi:hypothetical protein
LLLGNKRVLLKTLVSPRNSRYDDEMKKLIFTLALIHFSPFAQSSVVPEELNRLLGNATERILVGKTADDDRCELVLQKRNYGFVIRARDFDSNGEQVPQDYAAVFTITPYTNILDYWNDAFGMSYHAEDYSTISSEYDRRLYLDFERVSEKETILDARFRKGNGYFMYTYYKYKCEFRDLW